MAKNVCICSAPTKEELEKMINEFYFSKNYIITEDNRVYNTKKKTYLDDDMTVTYYRKRWKFTMKTM